MNTSSPTRLAVSSDPAVPSDAAHALILGCGFLGRRLATALLKQGVQVHAATRSQDHAVELAAMGTHPLILSVNQKLTLAAMSPLLDGRELEVYYMIPPGKPEPDGSLRGRLLEGIQNVLGSLRRANVKRAIMTSSTAVYDQGEGTAVSADTPAKPNNPRGQLLLDAENLWQTGGPSFSILRLAGLYGPGRVIGHAGILQGAPVVGDPQGLLNLIYVQDAVELLIQMMAAPQTGPIELGSDGNPIARLTYYNHLASLLGKPAPRLIDAQSAAFELGLPTLNLRKSSSKACDPTPTCQRTGWQPRVTDFRQGLALSLADSSS